MSFVLSYIVVAKWCLRFLIGMFFSSGLFSFLARLLRSLLHISPIILLLGNGWFFVYLAKYSLKSWAVFSLSLKLLELCPLHPIAFIIPLWVSIWFRCMVANSYASKPVSFRIVNIVAYLVVHALIILSMFSVLGIIGGFRSCL